MADNALTKLPIAGQAGVAAGIFAVACGAFYFFFYQPAQDEITGKKTKLEALEKEVRLLETAKVRLSSLQADLKVLESKLDTLKLILPPEKETPDLMKRVQYLATQSNLAIKRFTPGATVAKEFYQEWPISVDVNGTYHNLATFFDRISRLRRLVNIGNLKIRASTPQSLNSTIAASCTATTFVYVEPPPAAPKPPGK